MLVSVSGRTDGDGEGVRSDERWMVVMADVGSAVKGRREGSDTGRRVDSGTPVDSGSRGNDSVAETVGTVGGTMKLASEVTTLNVDDSCTKVEAADVSSWRDDDRGRIVLCSTLLEEACTVLEAADTVSLENGCEVVTEATSSWENVLVGVEVPRETTKALDCTRRSDERDTPTGGLVLMGVGSRSSVRNCEGVTDDSVGSTVASGSGETGKELDGSNVKDETVLAPVSSKLVVEIAIDVLPMTVDRTNLSEIAVVLASDGSDSVPVG